MIINENNKNTILQGMVKRGFNQTPKDIKDKMYPNAGQISTPKEIKNPNNQENKIAQNGGLRATFNTLKNLK